MKILVVEDEIAIRELISMNLEVSGYNVITAEDGEVAKNKIEIEDIDLVLLDIMLPKIDGFSLINNIKDRDIPVIFVTAKENVLDRVKGLKLGADDYIVKPFESIELLARVEVVLRRYNKEEKVIKFNNLEVDLRKRIVKNNNEIVEMTIKEYELLIFLIKNKNIALTRNQILEKVWGYDYEGETRTVDIHISRLRDKLEISSYIKTVYKLGYRFEM